MRYLSHVIILVWLLSGCASQGIYPQLSRSLQVGDCPNAMALMDNSQDNYGRNSKLLYLLDSAMVDIQCGDYTLAQEQLHAAEELADSLWTESISRNAAALVANDYTLPYAGEDYERVMIHLVSAIGYLQMEQLDEALVEVRRLNSLLEMFDTAISAEDVYKKDAFARYLSGMLHEADGASEDAYIDYHKAAGIYANEWQRYGTVLPNILKEDLMRMAVKVDRLDDARQVLGMDNEAVQHKAVSQASETGKVVLVVFNGEGPRKIQDVVAAPTPKGPVSIAFPRIVPGAPHCGSGVLELSGPGATVNGKLAIVSDINQIALHTLEDRQPRIVAKAVARTVAKQVVIHGVANQADTTSQQTAVAAFLNIANVVLLEKADTRSWRTLPGVIEASRIYAAPGEYSARVVICGRVFEMGQIKVATDKTHFLFLDARYGLSPEDRSTTK